MADATLRINADTRDLRRATKDLGTVEKQSRRTEKATKSLTRSYQGLGRTLGRIAGVISAGLITRSVIQNTVRQEQAVSQLNAVLRSTGRYTPEATQAVQDWAAALQQSTTFGDEAIIEAQNLLLTFKQIGGEEFPRATKAILDMSVAMNQGLKESTIQLGKALNDPITGLTAMQRVGITFTETQKELIKSMAEMGDIAGAQRLILEELESQFEGSAEAARNTLGGSLSALKNAFGDLLEGEGGSVSAATDAINDLVDTLNSPEVKEGFATFTAGIFRALEGLAQLPGVVGYLHDELRQLFGIIDNDDFERRAEEIAELEEQLQDARDATNRWWATENSIYHARAESLENEIRLKKAMLQADMDLAGLRRQAAGITLEELPGEDPIQRAPGAAQDDEAAATARLAEEIRKLGVARAADVELKKLSVADQLVLEIARENELIGLNNIQRQERLEWMELEEAQRLRALETGEQNIDLIIRENEALAEAQQQRRDLIAANEDLQESQAETGEASVDLGRTATSNLADVALGTKSLSEAFSDMASSIVQDIIRIIIQKTILNALGGFGFGGGSLPIPLGAGRAVGGRVYPGMLHPVNEHRPELLTMGNKQYLMPGPRGGKVEQNRYDQRQSNTTVINLPPPMPRQDAQQIAYQMNREQRKAQGRNR